MMDPIKVGDAFLGGRLVVASVDAEHRVVSFNLLPENGLGTQATLTPDTALSRDAIPNFIAALGL